MYDENALKDHPGANPHRGQLGKSGQFMGVYTTVIHRENVRVIGPFDASRWIPHQSARQRARYARPRAALEAKRAEIKLGLSSRYGRLRSYQQEAVESISAVNQQSYEDVSKALDAQISGITLIPEHQIGKTLMTSDKPIGQPQDSGNPVGKRVSWISSNTEKVGVITHVVPAGQTPADVGAKVKDANTARDHESFVVQGYAAKANTNGSASYWPRVSLLKFL